MKDQMQESTESTKSIVIVLPAYNEAAIIEHNVKKVVDFCAKNFVDNVQVVIADNGSTDQTPEIGKHLAGNFNNVIYFPVSQKGKGIAIKSAWQAHAADVYIFMDADLSTDISGLPALVRTIANGSDLAIGNRFHPNSNCERTLIRRIVSKMYQTAIKILLNTKVSDAPCGFKAIGKKAHKEILPQVKNNEWFFDSELVVRAERGGLSIAELPVQWKDIREGLDKSRVNILTLGCQYLLQIMKLRKDLP